MLNSFIGNLKRNPLLRRIIRRRTILCLVLGVGMVLTVLLTSKMPVTYRSTASVLLESYGKGLARLGDAASVIAPDAAKAQRSLAESKPVLARTAQIFGAELPGATPQSPLPAGFKTRIDGQLLFFQVDDRSADQACKLANAWASAFVDEMNQRAPSLETKRVLDKSVPALQQDWVAKQEALNAFERNTHYHASEFEQSPLRKTVDELTARLNQKNIELTTLLAEQDVLHSDSSFEAMSQLPRARKDLMLQSFGKGLEERRSRRLQVLETFKPESAEVKAADESLRAAEREFRDAAHSMMKQVELEVQTVTNEKARLLELLHNSEAELDKLKATAATHQVLRSEAQMAERLYTELAQKKSEADVSQSFEYSYARPWERAEASLIPVSPNWRRNLLLGFMLSLFLGIGAVRLAELFDDTVDISALEQHLGATPLGVVPLFKRLNEKQAYVLAHHSENSPAAESLKSICSALELNHGCDSSERGIVITISSAVHGEGKSFVASNLASIFASRGRKTLLIDADLRNGALSRVFQCREADDMRKNLANGHWSSTWAVNGTTPGYKLLPIGCSSMTIPIPVSPDRLTRLIERMKADFDVIIFDTPPVMSLPVACATGKCSNMTLIVCRSGITPNAQLQRALARLNGAGVSRVQSIVNAADGNLDAMLATIGNTIA